MENKLKEAALDLSKSLRRAVKKEAPEHISAWGAVAADLLSALGELLEGDNLKYNAETFRAHGLIRAANQLLKQTQKDHEELLEVANQIRTASIGVIDQSHRNAIHGLEVQVESQKLLDLEEEEKKLEADIERASAAYPNLQRKLQEREDLKRQINSLDENLNQLDADLPDLQQQLEKLKAREKKTSARKATLEKTIRSEELTINELEAEVKSRGKKSNEYNRTAKRLTKEIEELAKEADSRHQDVVRLKKLLKDVEGIAARNEGRS